MGANAFAHESGIHQDGVLKYRETYEIMRAEDVGWNTNKLVLGKHSGRAAFRARLDDLGIQLESNDMLNAAFSRFKDLADKKHEIFDEDLHALMSDVSHEESAEYYRVEQLEVVSRSDEKPKATMTLMVEGQAHETSAEGSGVVDASFKAIENIVNSNTDLQLYSVNAITSGTDSQGDVTVRLEKDGRIVNGVGSDTDIVMASVKAYLNALNIMLSKAKSHPQLEGI